MNTEKKLLPPNEEDCRRKEQLINEYLPFVRLVARRMASSLMNSIEPDDLIQDGVLGLIDAAQRFDAERGVDFKTFAEQRIRGAIIDALRRSAWPRGFRRQRRELNQAREAHVVKNGHEPSFEELAESLQTTATKVRRRLLRIRIIESTSHQTAIDENNWDNLPGVLIPSRPLQQDQAYEVEERRIKVQAAIMTLPWRERQIIKLYYTDDMPMLEIGRILGINESRVSQLHARAVVWLRDSLAPYRTNNSGGNSSTVASTPPSDEAASNAVEIEKMISELDWQDDQESL